MLSIEEGRGILHRLHEAGPPGMGLMVLSAESGVDLDSLRDFLQSHGKLFVKLNDGPNYTVNRFGPFKGSVEAMVAHLQVIHEREYDKKWRLRLLVVFLVGLYVGTHFDEVVELFFKWWQGTLP